MWSAVTLFSVVTFFMIGVRTDVKEVRASIKDVREKHVLEYRDLERVFRDGADTLEKSINIKLFDISENLGKNETSHIYIANKLGRIEEKLDAISEWQREHK